jgi:hypothetical protein
VRVGAWIRSVQPDEFGEGFLGSARSNPACKTVHCVFLCVSDLAGIRHAQPGQNSRTKRGLKGRASSRLLDVILLPIGKCSDKFKHALPNEQLLVQMKMNIIANKEEGNVPASRLPNDWELIKFGNNRKNHHQ